MTTGVSLSGYFDDSKSGDGSVWAAAGFVGYPDQWDAFRTAGANHRYAEKLYDGNKLVMQLTSFCPAVGEQE
jgi:hypothetical protein